MAQSHSRQGIPTKLTLEQFEEFVLPHLHIGSRGPQPQLTLPVIFNYILKRENQPAVEVFQNYLNPNLPANRPLFQGGENRGQALPCLQVLQMEGNRLRQLNYCFNGDRYQLADSQIFISTIDKGLQRH